MSRSVLHSLKLMLVTHQEENREFCDFSTSCFNTLFTLFLIFIFSVESVTITSTHQMEFHYTKYQCHYQKKGSCQQVKATIFAESAQMGVIFSFVISALELFTKVLALCLSYCEGTLRNYYIYM